MPIFCPKSVLQAKDKLWKRREAGAITDEELFRKAVELDPHDYMALHAVGEAHQSRNEIDEARRRFWKAIDEQPAAYGSYLALCDSYKEGGRKTDLAQGLMLLGMLRMVRDPEHAGQRETILKKLLGQTSLTKKFSTEELEWLLEDLALEPPAEPPDVTRKLLPYRLIQNVIDPPLEGLSPEMVDAIIQQGERCAPLLISLIRGYANGTEFGIDQFTVEAALALIGEGAGPDTMDALIECTRFADESIAETAAWAANRLAERFPKLASKAPPLSPVLRDLDVYDFCTDPDFEADDERGDGLLEDEEEFDDQPQQPAVRVERPGRNDPCWCGSGKKYKKCHLASDEETDRKSRGWEPAQPAPETESQKLSLKLLDYFMEQASEREVKAAAELFFGKLNRGIGDGDQIRFFDWLLTDYTPKRLGCTVAEAYLKKNRGTLTPGQKQAVEEWIQSRFGVYEVQRVEPGAGVQVTDLLLDLDPAHSEVPKVHQGHGCTTAACIFGKLTFTSPKVR
ncbi:MAG: SEC-C domain-containing protein [Acidobacteria bacterium]|nr:SEC-C domain-containing protein [Acidobacteriota bacterium]